MLRLRLAMTDGGRAAVRAVVARELGRGDPERFRRRLGEEKRVDQAIIHDDLSLPQHFEAADRQKAGIARTGPDQIDYSFTHRPAGSRPEM